MKTRLILTLFFICYFHQAYSQNIVINGSFEDTTQTGWRYRDCGMYYFQEAPPGGGVTSLMVPNPIENICNRNYAYQLFPDIQNGEIYRLTAWTRKFNSVGGGTIQLCKKISDLPPFDYILAFAWDSTASDIWTFLSVQDTFILEQNDTAAIALRPYYLWWDQTNGQQVYQLYDLVTLTKIISGISYSDFPFETINIHYDSEGISIHSETTINKIVLTNMQGTIYHKAIINKNTYYINTLGLSQGIYILTTTDIYNRTNVKKITVL